MNVVQAGEQKRGTGRVPMFLYRQHRNLIADCSATKEPPASEAHGGEAKRDNNQLVVAGRDGRRSVTADREKSGISGSGHITNLKITSSIFNIHTNTTSV